MDARERKWLDPITMALIFDALNRMVAEASGTGETKVAVSLRDRLALFLMYALVLRPRELLSLNVDSLRKPIEGAFVSTKCELVVDIQKDNRRKRILPIYNDGLIAMIEQYLADVRPHFTQNCDKSGDALFLSSHGKRMSYSILWLRFVEVLKKAGVSGQGYTLHSIRTGAICEMANHASLAAVEFWAGRHSRWTIIGFMPSNNYYRE